MFSNGLGDFVPVQGHCRHLTQIYADSHWMHPIILIVAPPASLKGVQRTSVMHLDSTGITGSWKSHLLIVILSPPKYYGLMNVANIGNIEKAITLSQPILRVQIRSGPELTRTLGTVLQCRWCLHTALHASAH